MTIIFNLVHTLHFDLTPIDGIISSTDNKDRNENNCMYMELD